MSRRKAAVFLVACSCLIGQGCTYRAWYEGFQERQRQECYNNRSQDEIQKCLDKVNSTTYDEYLKGREDPNRQPK